MWGGASRLLAEGIINYILFTFKLLQHLPHHIHYLDCTVLRCVLHLNSIGDGGSAIMKGSSSQILDIAT